MADPQPLTSQDRATSVAPDLRRSPLGDLGAIAGLAFLVIAVFRRHLLGREIYLGNFDRLNSFLNTLMFHVAGWRSNHFSAWDDSMFMGRNTFALPFTFPNALNRLVALLPADQFYRDSGDISISLLILAGWSAYLFIRALVPNRAAAFVGAALYQFSALAVLKVSQNDMSFAVIIQLPLLLWLVRGISFTRWRLRFLGLCLVLTHLLFFCFLQKVAYAVLLLGVYTLYLASSRRSGHLLFVVAGAGLVALIAAFPRIYGIVEELRELRRETPGYDLTDFDTLYRFQNFHAFDALRWFNDGIFGRYFGETMALHNNINITEGMLMFTSPLVPFLLLAGLLRWQGRWWGLFRPGQTEWLLFYALVAGVFAVVMSKDVYHLFFRLFLHMDFTHTRIVIAGLPLICALTAAILARVGGRERGTGRVGRVVTMAAVVVGAMGWGFVRHRAAATAVPQPLALTASARDWLPLIGTELSRLAGLRPPRVDGQGPVLVWMLPSAVGEILLSGLLVAALLLLALMARRLGQLRWLLFVVLAVALAVGAWDFADFQVNGPQVRTDRPFAENDSYAAAPDEFRPPTAQQIRAVHARLEAANYRSVFFNSTDRLPLFVSPHLGALWQLRQVDGYSSGVPRRLAALPWPTGILGLRTMTFGAITEDHLPWPLLAFLNVKYAIRPSVAFYKNAGAHSGTGELSSADILENPLPVAPRAFFARNAIAVPNLSAARDAITVKGSSPSQLIDPLAETVVETHERLPRLASGGSLQASYAGDKIVLKMTPATEPRLLVVNELYHPDWRARADGAPVAIMPANVAMRAILVPPGATRITLEFVPFCNLRNVLVAGLAALAAACAINVLLARFARTSR
jgi:hypothetical protein